MQRLEAQDVGRLDDVRVVAVEAVPQIVEAEERLQAMRRIGRHYGDRPEMLLGILEAKLVTISTEHIRDQRGRREWLIEAQDNVMK